MAVLALGLLVQVATAWNTFFFHSDEYFQIVEFGSYKLSIAPAAVLPWEYAAKIRPALQPYLFALAHRLAGLLGIDDRFTVFSLVHLATGLFGFALTNAFVLKAVRGWQGAFWALALNNFLALVPFLRCSFSSETMGGLALMLSLLWLDNAFQKDRPAGTVLFSTGLVMAFSFFFRFQMAFALVGTLVWLLAKQWGRWQPIFLLAAGFFVGVAVNVLLDHRYYGAWCFTPYNYFVANIIEGKAAAFGVSPWWYYVPVLIGMAVPPLSLSLFKWFGAGLFDWSKPFAGAMSFFIIGHSLIGHKEERFLFPVLLFLVPMAAMAYRDRLDKNGWIERAWNGKGWKKGLLRTGLYFSVAINLLVVMFLSLEPYKQPVKFINVLNRSLMGKECDIVCFGQSPYQTESRLVYHYLSGQQQRCMVYNDKAGFLKALSAPHGRKTYYAIKYEDAMNNGLRNLVAGKTGIVSSAFVWRLANWLGDRFGIYLPDIWLASEV